MGKLNPGEALERFDGKGWVRVSKRPLYFLPDAKTIEWLSQAARLPGRTLHLAVAIALLSKLRRSRTVRAPNWVLDNFNVTPEAYRLGLRNLETARLVSVVRHRGRKPIITVLLVKENTQKLP